jgi:hypothetical protein
MTGWLTNLFKKQNRGSGVDSVAAPAGLICPQCRSGDCIPIVYGAPSEVHMRLTFENKAAAGGAMRRLIGGNAPTWECRSCKNRWRGPLFGGGSGSSMADAVVIQDISSTGVGIRAEKQWLTEQHGLDQQIAEDPNGWKIEKQELIESRGCQYDRLTIAFPDGRLKTVYFDITSFFGKNP